jgi:transposase
MDENATHWAGIDVAKKTFDGAVVFCGQHFPHTPLREVPAGSFERSREGARLFVDWLHEQVNAHGQPAMGVRVVMESTGAYSLELTQWLLECRATLSPAIINPQRTANFLKSLGLRNKTDRLEARALAFYGAERRPAPHEPLAPALAQLRDLNRYRDFLVAERVAVKNREDDASGTKLVCQMSKRRASQLDRDIKAIEKQMRSLISETDDLKRKHALLASIPGVGFLSVCTILAELGNLRRFERSRQLSAFVGVNPRLYLSGTSVHGQSHMSKSGSSRVRQALYMSALAAIRMAGPQQAVYDRLIASGKKPMVALGAVMRKLLVLMRAMLITETPYNKDYQAGLKPVDKLAFNGG